MRWFFFSFYEKRNNAFKFSYSYAFKFSLYVLLKLDLKRKKSWTLVQNDKLQVIHL